MSSCIRGFVRYPKSSHSVTLNQLPEYGTSVPGLGASRHVCLFGMTRLKPDRKKRRGQTTVALEGQSKFHRRVWIGIGGDTEHQSTTMHLAHASTAPVKARVGLRNC